MGDKGGKKDKAKNKQQQVTKRKQEEVKKQDKAGQGPCSRKATPVPRLRRHRHGVAAPEPEASSRPQPAVLFEALTLWQ